MINRKHRIIASLLLCVMLFSVMIVPISHSVKQPGYLLVLWIALTTALDILDAIERFIGIITQDLKEMEDAVAEANDELNDVLYPEREKREEQIQELQTDLDELNAEHEAAEKKARDAKSRIRSLKSEIKQAEADLAMLSPWEYSAREALELHISMLKSSLKSAEQDLKDAEKITGSLWRSAKRAWLDSSISGLERQLILQVTSRINRLENLTDRLRPKIKKKQGELAAEEPRRKAAQEDVDRKRAAYDEAKKKGDPKDQK